MGKSIVKGLNQGGKKIGIDGAGDFFTKKGFNEDMSNLGKDLKNVGKTISKPFVGAVEWVDQKADWAEKLVTGKLGAKSGGSAGVPQGEPEEVEIYDVCDGHLSETTLAFETMLMYDVAIYSLFNEMGLDMSKCLRLDCLHPEYEGNVCTECLLADYGSVEEEQYCGHCANVVEDEYEAIISAMGNI